MSSPSTWSSLLGYSRVTWTSAMLANFSAMASVSSIMSSPVIDEERHERGIGGEQDEGGRGLHLDHRVAVGKLEHGGGHDVEVRRHRGEQRAAEAREHPHRRHDHGIAAEPAHDQGQP